MKTREESELLEGAEPRSYPLCLEGRGPFPLTLARDLPYASSYSRAYLASFGTLANQRTVTIASRRDNGRISGRNRSLSLSTNYVSGHGCGSVCVCVHAIAREQRDLRIARVKQTVADASSSLTHHLVRGSSRLVVSCYSTYRFRLDPYLIHYNNIFLPFRTRRSGLRVVAEKRILAHRAGNGGAFPLVRSFEQQRKRRWEISINVPPPPPSLPLISQLFPSPISLEILT